MGTPARHIGFRANTGESSLENRNGQEMKQQVFDLSHEMENPMTRSGKVFPNERQLSHETR
jgi:hypothetical protein